MQTFAVTIPRGIRPGQEFQADLDGQLTMVTVPQGSAAGSTLHVKVPSRRVQASEHKAIPRLMELDDRLEDALRSGAIKLIIADRVRDGTIGTNIARRQDLEERERAEKLRIFETPEDAIKLLRRNGREIGSLTYGWDTPDGSDPSGDYLRAVCRFLLSELGAHVKAIFWDACSLPQEPRSESDAMVFKEALEVMADMYASVLGTMVMRHRSVPARPASLDGEVVVLMMPKTFAATIPRGIRPGQTFQANLDGQLTVVTVPQGSAAGSELHVTIGDATAESAVHRALSVHGAIERVGRDELGRYRARFASHADAERAVAAGPFVGATAIFTYHNARPYAARGWTSLESGVSTEGLSRAAYLPGLKATLERLPPKLVEIDGEAPEAASEQYGGSEGAGPRIERVRSSIRDAVFTGKGDKEVVMRLYDEYITKIGNAMNAGEGVAGEYEGERNAAGEEEGRGTYRYANGAVYEGEWKAGKQEGRGKFRWDDGDEYEGEFKADQIEGHGTYRFANGDVYEGEWMAGKQEGRGTKWSAAGAIVFEGEWKAGEPVTTSWHHSLARSISEHFW
eukprot:jgi/Chrpa1/7992/Chrysochromulina_OHIO_Genome00003271-RA